MKKRRFVAIAALLLLLLTVLVGCSEKTPPSEGEGGSDIAPEADTSVVIETTLAEPRYSESDKLIALTYDDGPHPEYTNRILDILEENDATATFFVIGYNIDKNIDTIKRAMTMGCEIGNHTNDHKNLTKSNMNELRDQVDTPNEKIKKLTGTEMKLFRAPGGAFSGISNEVDMPLIQWSIDTEDWKAKDAAHKDRTEEERDADLRRIADFVVQNAQKGDIILMHDIYNFTADLSELVIPELVADGFKIVSVSEMYEVYNKPLQDGKIYYNIKIDDSTTTQSSDAVLEAGEYRVKTNGGDLNIRIEPKQESILIAKLSNGDRIKVIKAIPGWALVESPDACGWVNASYLVK